MKTPNRKEIQQQIDEADPNTNGTSSKFYRINKANFLLQVTPSKSKSWVFRYTLNKRTRVKGLGSAAKVSFTDAERAARKLRVLLDDGIDPLEERDIRLTTTRKAKGLARQRRTFQECAEEFIAARSGEWSNKKHSKDWTSSLKKHVYPHIGALPIEKIDVDAVLKVIEPIYEPLNETAVRLRGRIERIIGYSMVRGWRPDGPNPAKWTGYLSTVFASRASVRTVAHHPAMPYAELPDFMQELKKAKDAASPLMMRFMVLTAARTGEARTATWSEIDFDKALWSVPAQKMKSRKPHEVPLSKQALQVLHEVKEKRVRIAPQAFIFPGGVKDKPISDGAALQLFKRMGKAHFTPHGTSRSSFRQWVAAETDYPGEVAEAALAHQIENRVEAAYQRDSLIGKRRLLMEEWGAYCDGLRVDKHSLPSGDGMEKTVGVEYVQQQT